MRILQSLAQALLFVAASRQNRHATRAAAMLVLMLAAMIPTTAAFAQPLTLTLKDALGRPVAGAAVSLAKAGGAVIASGHSDSMGNFRVAAPARGSYQMRISKSGFKPALKSIVMPADASAPVSLVMESQQALTLPITVARNYVPNGLSDTGASKYTFTSKDIENLPEGEATPLNEVLLQMPGVALDQNQEIHIRGEHAGIQYQLNGIMLPLDINNDPTFTQLLNSYFVQSVSLIDGVLPAEYGYRTSGVVDIHSRSGCGGAQNEFTIYGGERDAASPSFALGGCHGDFSYYLTGVYEHSNLGLSSATPGTEPIHDTTNQGQGFAYLTYNVSSDVRLSLISGMTVAANQFPNRPNLPPMYALKGAPPAGYPSADIDSNLDQRDYYAVFALDGAPSERAAYQLAYSVHYNRENFNPDPPADLIYQGISSKIFTSDLSNSLQGSFSYQLGAHALKTGFYFGEYGVESDNTSQAFPIVGGKPLDTPISVTSDLNKINLVYGVYIQDTWKLTDTLSVNYGSRWDRVSGFANDSQFSPTINFIWKARPDTTIHAGFARNFQVPNFQNLSSGITKLSGTTGGVGPGIPLGTSLYAETDYTWDVGYCHQIAPNLVMTQDSYFRIDRHYLDEGQFGFVPLDAPFNYVRGYGAGLENSLTYTLPQLTLRGTVFVAREEVRGVASGQYNFSPLAQLEYIDKHYIVLDHTPLVGASWGAAYRWRRYNFTFDGLYSSGLRGGFANTTQLPNVWQFNASGARDFDLPRIGTVTDRIVLINLFDRTNLIRPATGIGVFQSAYGPRFAVYDALTIPLPAL
jgi:outer membrane receptor protein involved in Fe transport